MMLRLDVTTNCSARSWACDDRYRADGELDSFVIANHLVESTLQNQFVRVHQKLFLKVVWLIATQ
jgi:hypothetical protein